MALYILAHPVLLGSKGQVGSPTSLSFPSEGAALTGLSSCCTLAGFFFGTGDHAAGPLSALIPEFLADTHIYFPALCPGFPICSLDPVLTVLSCRGSEGLRN